MPESATPAYITALISHFEDLRDGTHGEKAVQLLAPVARQVLTAVHRAAGS